MHVESVALASRHGETLHHNLTEDDKTRQQEQHARPEAGLSL